MGCVDLRYRECVVCCLILVVVVVWVGWGVCLVGSCVGEIGVGWCGMDYPCAWICCLGWCDGYLVGVLRYLVRLRFWWGLLVELAVVVSWGWWFEFDFGVWVGLLWMLQFGLWLGWLFWWVGWILLVWECFVGGLMVCSVDGFCCLGFCLRFCVCVLDVWVR